MYQALVVGMLKPMCGLGDVVSDQRVGQWAVLFYQDLQIDTLDILHHDVMGVFLVGDVVSPNDIRMG